MPVPVYVARELEAEEIGDVQLLPAEPNSQWRYTHYRSNWDAVTVDGETVWVPQLGKLLLLEGSNHVATAPAGEGNSPDRYDDAYKEVRKKKGVVLVDAREYVSAYDCQGRHRKGVHYAEKFTRPVPSSVPGRRLKWRMDRDAYNRWLVTLMVRGLIETPTEDETKRYHHAAAKRVRRAEADTEKTADQRAETVARAKVRVDVAEAADAGTDDAIDAAEAEAPKPKPRRRRSAKEAAK